MMEFPSELVEVIERVAQQYSGDIPAAVEQAEKEIVKLPCYKQTVTMLVRRAIMELIYGARHKTNVAIKRDTGYYEETAKQKVGLDETGVINRVYKSVYDYCIGAKTLGYLTGKELPELASKERNQASGHLFNAALLDWLQSQGVTGDKKVREVVGERKLRATFDRLYKELQKAG